MASDKKDGALKTSGARRKGNGAGWGGPAKGTHPPKPRHDFDKQAGPGRGHYSVEGEARLERQARHAEVMKQILFGVATSEVADDGVRVQAAEKMLNRLEGLPVQKVITAETDPVSMLSDDQLDDEIERTRRREAKLKELEEAQSAVRDGE